MEILVSFLIIFVAVFVMIQAGKVVVRSLSVVARFLRLSEYVISFALIALADILGEEKALSIVSGNNNFTWIRKMVIARARDIDPIISKYFPEVVM